MKNVEALFRVELSTFEQMLPSWLPSHEGEFAVICGEVVHGLFDDQVEAYRAGLSRFGTSQPFLLQQVVPEQMHAIAPGVCFADE
jgi:hypothetical protein